MDISVSSNFERLLFDLYDRDGAAIADLMRQFDQGAVTFSAGAMAQARALFSSHRVSDEQTCAQIAATWQACEYLLDPHSAIGVKAASESGLPAELPIITLATAHPAKFPEAIASAGLDIKPSLPPHLADLFERPERYVVLADDLAAVQAAMVSAISN